MTSLHSAAPTASADQIRAWIDALCDQLSRGVDGRFDFIVSVDTDDETIGKLQMLINFVLDVARRAMQEQQAQQQRLEQVTQRRARLNLLQQELLGPGDLTSKLKEVTTNAVQLLDLDFCRIWVTRPGDRCASGCPHAPSTAGEPRCTKTGHCLHLLASSGRYTHTDGGLHARIPFACYKIGATAADTGHKLVTNDILNDPHVHDHEWARSLGLVSFAGYQLRPPGSEAIGVLAAFSRNPITPDVDGVLETLANSAALVIQRDVAEEEQKTLQGQLLQALRLESVGRLAAGIAHEINTPTQFVSDNTRFVAAVFPKLSELLAQHKHFLETCRDQQMPSNHVAELITAMEQAKLDYLLDQIPEALSDSLEGLERVTCIVRAMKDFAHPGQQAFASADLNRAIESTVTVARNEWKYVAEMELNLDPALPPVACQLGEFNQVILNLVVNAAHAIKDVVQYGAGKGTITVWTRHDGDFVEIRVSDTGPGIPPEIRDKVFDHFFTTKEVGKGTGQGLSLAHRVIVEQHRGSLTFETDVGRGTTFVIRLPVEAPPCAARASADEAGSPLPLSESAL
ncbi:MAG: ATP-binding protein [Phycisphaerae bacterium]